MRRFLLSVVALLIGGVAYAQEVTVTPMSIEQIVLLAKGLKSLDTYKLDGDTRWAIAQDLNGIQHMARSYASVREALIAQYSKDGVKVADENIARFNADERKMLSQVTSIGFIHISRKALNLQENQIPPSVIVALLPILD